MKKNREVSDSPGEDTSTTVGGQVGQTEADGLPVTMNAAKLVYWAVGLVVAFLLVCFSIIDNAKKEIREDVATVRSEVSNLRNDVTSLTGRLGRIEGILEQRTGSTKTDSGFAQNRPRADHQSNVVKQ